MVKNIFHRCKKAINIDDIRNKNDSFGNKDEFQNCYHKYIFC